MWDLSSQARDQTQVPCSGKWILNHWTTREVPQSRYLIFERSSKFFFFLRFSRHQYIGPMEWWTKIWEHNIIAVKVLILKHVWYMNERVFVCFKENKHINKKHRLTWYLVINSKILKHYVLMLKRKGCLSTARCERNVEKRISH